MTGGRADGLFDGPVARPADLERRREEWERRRRRLRTAQNVGLAVLAIGVLLLAYVALVASGR